jgi:hypothetical protein
LFEHPKRNESRIAETIFLIAQNFARKYRGMPAEWLEDAVSEAVMLGIRKIDRFRQLYLQRPGRMNAFLWFTKLVQNKVKEQLKIEACKRAGKPAWSWQKEARAARESKRKTMRRACCNKGATMSGSNSDVQVQSSSSAQGKLATALREAYSQLKAERDRALTSLRTAEVELKKMTALMRSAGSIQSLNLKAAK